MLPHSSGNFRFTKCCFTLVIMIVSLAIARGAPTSEHEATNPINANLAQAVKADQHPIPVFAAAVATASDALASTSSSIDVSSRSAPVAKQLFFADLPLVKTPASATKLASLTTPLIGPIAPFTYASPTILASYPAWNGLAAFPATYSIEQHGYHIAY